MIEALPVLAFWWLTGVVISAGTAVIVTIAGVTYKALLIGGDVVLYILSKSSGSTTW